MRIFFGGPLTNLHDPDATKAFYDRLGTTAQAYGFDFFLAFRNGTDPIKNPEVLPNAVYDVDTKELSKSDLMVAYVGEPSTGTGIEIGFAREHGIPVYLLYEKGRRVSRMMRGSPAVKGEIVFATFDEAIAKFADLLQSLQQ